MNLKYLLLFFILSLPLKLLSQNDTLWVKNGNVLFGDIKDLSSGIITMETPYSDDDFTIDYDGGRKASERVFEM